MLLLLLFFNSKRFIEKDISFSCSQQGRLQFGCVACADVMEAQLKLSLGLKISL